jgi:hypothetical protein
MTYRNVAEMTGIATVAIAIALTGSGCFGTAQVSTPVGVPNPTRAVIANCRELVCTHADVPSCDFEQVRQGPEVQAIVDSVHCARSEDGTDCEETRAPDPNLGHTHEPEVLKFHCAGDPVECWTTGGNATWETTLDPTLDGGKPLQYPCREGRPTILPAGHPVPGPDTV